MTANQSQVSHTHHSATGRFDITDTDTITLDFETAGLYGDLDKVDIFALMYGGTPTGRHKDDRRFALLDSQRAILNHMTRESMLRDISNPVIAIDPAKGRDATVAMDIETDGDGYQYPSQIRWYFGHGLHADGTLDEYASLDGGLSLDLMRRYFPLPIPEVPGADENDDKRRARRAKGKMTGNDRRKESADAKQAMRDRCLAKLKKSKDT